LLRGELCPHIRNTEIVYKAGVAAGRRRRRGNWFKDGNVIINATFSLMVSGVSVTGRQNGSDVRNVLIIVLVLFLLLQLLATEIDGNRSRRLRALVEGIERILEQIYRNSGNYLNTLLL
jgi:hypothetical protein